MLTGQDWKTFFISIGTPLSAKQIFLIFIRRRLCGMKPWRMPSIIISNNNPDYQMVILAGKGHVEYRFRNTIPNRTADRPKACDAHQFPLYGDNGRNDCRLSFIPGTCYIAEFSPDSEYKSRTGRRAWLSKGFHPIVLPKKPEWRRVISFFWWIFFCPDRG